jgi:hypothetical protein
MARGISRMLIGDEVADELGLEPAPGWARALKLVPPLIGLGERVRTRVPALERRLRIAGVGYWAWAVEASLRGDPARFARPDQLAT